MVGHLAKLVILLKVLSNISIKKFVLASLTLMFCTISFAQYQGAQSDFWSRVRYGGGLGLGFSNNSFTIAVSPSAIYQVSDQFATGLGLSFNYSEFEESKFSAFGGRIVNFFSPIPQAQLSAEFEHLRVNREDIILGQRFEESFWVPALYLGVGFGNRNVMAGFRYDVLYDVTKSIYASPWAPFVRVYF